MIGQCPVCKAYLLRSQMLARGDHGWRGQYQLGPVKFRHCHRVFADVDTPVQWTIDAHRHAAPGQQIVPDIGDFGCRQADGRAARGGEDLGCPGVEFAGDLPWHQRRSLMNVGVEHANPQGAEVGALTWRRWAVELADDGVHAEGECGAAMGPTRCATGRPRTRWGHASPAFRGMHRKKTRFLTIPVFVLRLLRERGICQT